MSNDDMKYLIGSIISFFLWAVIIIDYTAYWIGLIFFIVGNLIRYSIDTEYVSGNIVRIGYILSALGGIIAFPVAYLLFLEGFFTLPIIIVIVAIIELYHDLKMLIGLKE